MQIHGVFKGDRGHAQLLGHRNVLFAVVHKRRFLRPQTIGLEQQVKDPPVRLCQLDRKAGDAPLKQLHEPAPFGEQPVDVLRQVRQKINVVSRGFQVRDEFDRVQFGGHHLAPVVQHQLRLIAAGAGGRQHLLFGKSAGDEARVQFFPLFAAENRVIKQFFQLWVVELPVQIVFGVVIHDHAAEIEDNIFDHWLFLRLPPVLSGAG